MRVERRKIWKNLGSKSGEVLRIRPRRLGRRKREEKAASSTRSDWPLVLLALTFRGDC